VTCVVRATIELFQVIEADDRPLLISAGVFCGKHWAEERRRRRSRGERTGMTVFHDDRGPCCWLPGAPIGPPPA